MAQCLVLDPTQETSAHLLDLVATDFTLAVDWTLHRNCRNISDEVFPGIHLGDK